MPVYLAENSHEALILRASTRDAARDWIKRKHSKSIAMGTRLRPLTQGEAMALQRLGMRIATAKPSLDDRGSVAIPFAVFMSSLALAFLLMLKAPGMVTGFLPANFDPPCERIGNTLESPAGDDCRPVAAPADSEAEGE